MKKILRTLCGFLLFSFFVIVTSAQSPGQIVRPAGGPYSSVLDVNQDGYTSVTTSGFTTSDIGSAYSELNYIVVPPAITEPTGDLATGPSGGFSDIVKTIDGSGFYVYSNGTNIYFRLRIGSIISGSKGYSILIDTDGKMGNSGPSADPNYVAPTNLSNGNPGFEYEVVYETNFQVQVFNVNGTANPVSVATYSLNTNSQISVALSTDGNNPDYFYDWFIPLSAIGSPSSIRMAATTVTSPGSALQGSRSDIYGIDDATSGVANAWQTVINAQPPISITGSGISSVGATCTAAPTLNFPVTTGSSISVSGTWTRMDASKPSTATITLYKNGSAVNTTTVTTGNSWAITVPAIISGDIFYAKAQAAGESQCLQSNNVIAGCTNQTSVSGITVTCGTLRGFDGTMPAGAVVRIYTVSSGGYSLFADETSTTYKITHPSSTRWIYDGPNVNSSDPCTGGATDVPAASYAITIQLAGQCESDYYYYCDGLSTTTATPTITQATLYNSSATVSGTASASSTVRMFINGKLYSTTTADGSGNYSFSSVVLNVNDVVDIYAQSSGQCVSSKVSRTVSCFTTAPSLNTVNGNLIIGTTAITGNSVEPPGATIKLYDNANTLLGTTTVQANGSWSITTTVASGKSYYATAQNGSCSVSGNSASASALAATTICPAISASYTSSSTSVTGTLGSSFTGTVRLYLDGVQIGSTSVTSATTWTINSPFTYSLYPGGTLAATTQTTGSAEKTDCGASVTIGCTSPSTPAISPTSATIHTGQTVTFSVSSIVSNTWYAVMDNSGSSYATSVYTNSASNFSITTSTFNSTGTFNLKLSADQLSGCPSSYTTASILVNPILLPVTFINISAKKENSNQNKINWTVTNEQDIQYYEIERSHDCRNFESAGKVFYQPTNLSSNSYSFIDNTINATRLCYRVKQVDNNGNYKYSDIVSIAGNKTKTTVSPNPAGSQATIYIDMEKEGPAKIELIDLNGRKILQKPVLLYSGSNAVKLYNLNYYQRGTYILKLFTPGEIHYLKLILQ